MIVATGTDCDDDASRVLWTRARAVLAFPLVLPTSVACCEGLIVGVLLE
jgi:hypothetical protein